MIELGVEPRRKSVAIEEDEPSHYLVLGNFGGRALEPVAVDRDNFDAVITKLDVSLAGARFRRLEDFHPDNLYRNLPFFREFDRTPQPPSPEPATPKADLEELLRSSSLLEQIVAGESGDPFENYVQALARAHAATPESSDPEREATLGERMRGILHHPRFQSVEAAWRGLDFAIRASDSDAGARVFITHYPQEEAAKDLNGATSLRATRAFALFNARKWRAVIGLYSFTEEAADIEFLGRMALLAAHVRAPFLAEGAVDMGEHWEELRSIPEASYLGLAVPRFLLRPPYGAQSSPLEVFPFEEMAAGPPEHSHLLWGNPALACLALLTTGGDALNLEGLPMHTYQKDGEWKLTPCAEVWMTEAQVLALIDVGLMPLVAFKDSDRVRLAGFRAVNGEELPLA
jgi:type VI secretion system protein ImpC